MTCSSPDRAPRRTRRGTASGIPSSWRGQPSHTPEPDARPRQSFRPRFESRSMPGIRERLPLWPATAGRRLRASRRIRLGHSSRAADSNVAMSSESFCLCVVGRLHGVTRPRLAGLVTAAGGRLVRAGSRKATLVCLAHSTAPERLSRGADAALPAGCRVMSELSLRRLIGLAPPLPSEHRTLTAADVARQARLSPEVVRCLALYDVLEPSDDDAYGYRDL